jgi:hypothetical protein
VAASRLGRPWPLVGPRPRAGARLFPWLALLLVLNCAPDGAASQREVPAAAPLPEKEFAAAVLVAGSDEQPVFDNARRALVGELRAVSRAPLALATLSASRGTVAAGDALPATLAGIEAAFTRTAPGASACLFFATSHGTRRGLVLTHDDELLTPARLDAVLDRHCAGRPTIAILSGCFSGVFADPPMPAPDRVILTAAARDRPSFGCGDDETYTYFDEALLRLLPDARGWDELHARLAAAVAERERGLGERPSRPRASFGAAVPRDLLLGREDRP